MMNTMQTKFTDFKNIFIAMEKDFEVVVETYNTYVYPILKYTNAKLVDLYFFFLVFSAYIQIAFHSFWSMVRRKWGELRNHETMREMTETFDKVLKSYKMSMKMNTVNERKVKDAFARQRKEMLEYKHKSESMENNLKDAERQKTILQSVINQMNKKHKREMNMIHEEANKMRYELDRLYQNQQRFQHHHQQRFNRNKAPRYNNHQRHRHNKWEQRSNKSDDSMMHKGGDGGRRPEPRPVPKMQEW